MLFALVFFFEQKTAYELRISDWSSGVCSSDLIVKAMSTVNYQPKATWFTQGTYPEFGEQLGDAANGIMTWSTWDPEIDWTGAELAGEQNDRASSRERG